MAGIEPQASAPISNINASVPPGIEIKSSISGFCAGARRIRQNSFTIRSLRTQCTFTSCLLELLLEVNARSCWHQIDFPIVMVRCSDELVSHVQPFNLEGSRNEVRLWRYWARCFSRANKQTRCAQRIFRTRRTSPCFHPAAKRWRRGSESDSRCGLSFSVPLNHNSCAHRPVA
jgi:hypothetical protein